MQKNISINEIRDKWLRFFRNKGYHLIQPVSLVPDSDPSLLWINSGVAGLKKYFSNPSLAPAHNLVNCQRVIRTDDLSNINAQSYHQTLFEMLGIFSIGGNFKQETIPYFWEFFTSPNWLGLKPERLFITVYEKDSQTYEIWKEQKGVIVGHILYGSKKTNFWDMGDGPCGPNTEIYYDFQTDTNFPKSADDLDNKRFLEICNIVFSEFYHKKEDYLPLKEKCVDVGAGLERITMVVQEKINTFQIDLWEKLIELIEEYHKKVSKTDEQKGSYYIIADHLRTAIFALADGAIIGPKGRGYILKKLIKRSCLFSYFIGLSSDNLLTVSKKIIEINSCFYVNLKEKEAYITESIEKEIKKEMKFIVSAVEGIDKYCLKNSQKTIPANEVFLWYDTYGIPSELLHHYLQKKGKEFSKKEFSKLLEKQKELGKKDRKAKKIDVFS